MEIVPTMQFRWARDWNYRQGAVAVESYGEPNGRSCSSRGENEPRCLI